MLSRHLSGWIKREQCQVSETVTGVLGCSKVQTWRQLDLGDLAGKWDFAACLPGGGSKGAVSGDSVPGRINSQRNLSGVWEASVDRAE